MDTAVSDPCNDNIYGVEPCAEPMTCEVVDGDAICVEPCHQVQNNDVYVVCDEASQDCYVDSNGHADCK